MLERLFSSLTNDFFERMGNYRLFFMAQNRTRFESNTVELTPSYDHLLNRLIPKNAELTVFTIP